MLSKERKNSKEDIDKRDGLDAPSENTPFL